MEIFPPRREFERLSRKGNVVPVYGELLADMETPVSAFLKLDDGRFSYLLESVEGSEKVARFSFIGTSPRLVFSSTGRHIEISETGRGGRISVKRFETKTDPLREIEKLMRRFRAVALPDLPRFCGGLVGYLGYDVVRFIEPVPPPADPDLAMPDTLLMLSDTMAIFDHARHRLLLVACQGQTFGIPTHGIERLHRIRVQDLESVEGRPVVRLKGQPVPLASLAHLLKIGEPVVSGEVLPVVTLRWGERRLAVAVDAFLSVRDGLIQDAGVFVEGTDKLTGGILLEDGTVCLALNPLGLVNASKESNGTPTLKKANPAPEQRPSTILVVDDSVTTRTLEKSILEAHGYRVRVAVDGAEALDRLRAEVLDLVVADIQMPRMDGFTLLEEMKRDRRLSQIPVILVTSMERSEDQERGLALGADAYIVKRKFDQRELLDTIEQML